MPRPSTLVARLAAGGMRDAESILDQVLASAGDRISADAVRELLGLADAETSTASSTRSPLGDARPARAPRPARGSRPGPAVFLDQVVDALASGSSAAGRCRRRPTADGSPTPPAGSPPSTRRARRRAACASSSSSPCSTPRSRRAAIAARAAPRRCLARRAAPSPAGGRLPPRPPTPVAAPAPPSPPSPSAPVRPTPVMPPRRRRRERPRPPTPAAAPAPTPTIRRRATPRDRRPATTSSACVRGWRIVATSSSAARRSSRSSRVPPDRASTGNVVTLGFPEEQAFLRDMAETARRPRGGVGGVPRPPVGVRASPRNVELLPPLPATGRRAHPRRGPADPPTTSSTSARSLTIAGGTRCVRRAARRRSPTPTGGSHPCAWQPAMAQQMQHEMARVQAELESRPSRHRRRRRRDVASPASRSCVSIDDRSRRGRPRRRRDAPGPRRRRGQRRPERAPGLEREDGCVTGGLACPASAVEPPVSQRLIEPVARLIEAFAACPGSAPRRPSASPTTCCAPRTPRRAPSPRR